MRGDQDKWIHFPAVFLSILLSATACVFHLFLLTQNENLMIKVKSYDQGKIHLARLQATHLWLAVNSGLLLS